MNVLIFYFFRFRKKWNCELIEYIHNTQHISNISSDCFELLTSLMLLWCELPSNMKLISSYLTFFTLREAEKSEKCSHLQNEDLHDLMIIMKEMATHKNLSTSTWPATSLLLVVLGSIRAKLFFYNEYVMMLSLLSWNETSHPILWLRGELGLSMTPAGEDDWELQR